MLSRHNSKPNQPSAGCNHPAKNKPKKMKLQHPLLLTVAVAGSLWAGHASAQNFAAGDLMLGVRSTANTATNLVFDLGSASSYLSAQTASSLNGDAAQIISTFGSLNNLYFSVVGYVDPADAASLGFAADTLFLTKVRSAPLDPTNPNIGISPSASLPSQSATRSRLASLANGANLSYAIAPGVAGEKASQNVNGNISYANGIEVSGNPSLSGSIGGTWGRYSVEGATSATFSGDNTSVSLDLYEQTPGTANQGQFVGTFTLGSSGTLGFIPTSVPEPSTYAMIGSGLLALVAARRIGRKN
jgi:hypothetical protein